jgi:4-hydroxybenzoate polyprenyltransferase
MNFIKLLRPHHYVKNLLIFVPVITANEFSEINIGSSIFFFFIFCLTSSVGYIFNDIKDKDHDQQIEYKQSRPLASGAITTQKAMIFCICLFVSVILISLLLNPFLIYLMWGYLLLSFFYSSILKKLYLIDVMALSSLYLYRIFTGGIMFNIEISFWLLVFSMFFFFSLSLVKRISELSHINGSDELILLGRAYSRNDIDMLSHLAISSSLISVLVFFLYIDFASSIQQYENYSPLIAINLIIFLWFLRIFSLAKSNMIGSDPIAFAIKDLLSICLLFVSITLIFLSNFKF